MIFKCAKERTVASATPTRWTPGASIGVRIVSSGSISRSCLRKSVPSPVLVTTAIWPFALTLRLSPRHARSDASYPLQHPFGIAPFTARCSTTRWGQAMSVALASYGLPVQLGFEATGNCHRPLARRPPP